MRITIDLSDELFHPARAEAVLPDYSLNRKHPDRFGR